MPIGQYLAVFVVSGTPYGFDPVRTSGYSRGRQANATVRPVPWPSVAGVNQQVVVQLAGTQPATRRYQVLFYTETDFENMLAMVGESGYLATPREVVSIPAILMNCQSSESIPDNYTVGATLEFQIIG